MRPLVLEDFLPYRLARLASAVSVELRAVYAGKHGLTVPEWRVLATLGQYGEATATAVGRHSAMHKAKVSRAVIGLAKRRWLSRTANPSDRREAALRLTALGRSTYDDLVTDMRAYEAELARRLGAAGLMDVDRALARLERVQGLAQSRSAGRREGGDEAR